MARGVEGTDRMLTRLREIQSSTGDRIRDIRHRGMWIGLTFRDNRSQKVLLAARERGLLVNAIGDDKMRFAPSLLITDQEIDLGAQRFAEALSASD